MSKLDKRAISTTLVIAMFLLSMITVLPIAEAVTITTVTPTDVPVGPAYTALTGPIIVETAIAEFGVGTIVLTAPAGFEFDTTASSVTATVAPGDLLLAGAASQIVTPMVSTITIDVSQVSGAVSTITYTGIEIRTDDNVAGTTGSLDFSGTSGPTGSAGTLTSIPAAASQLAFTEQPYTNPDCPVYVPFDDGQPVVEIQDQYGNLVPSSTATVELTDVTASDGTGNGVGYLTGTTSLAAEAGVATFTDIGYTEYDEIYLKATSGTLIFDVSFPIQLFGEPPLTGLSIDQVTDTSYNTKDSGNYGDKIIVLGSGVTSGAVVNLYWDYVNAAGLVNNTEANPDGSFEVWFKVPEAVYGDHYLWVKDVGTGGTASFGPFTVGAKVKLSPSSGLKTDKVTINGYGFSEDAKVDSITWDAETITTLYPTIPETDDLGSWTATFKVPTDVNFYIYAEDEKGVVAPAALFKVGASISLSPSSGPVGSVVEISGRGFFDSVDLTIPADDTVATFGTYDCLVISGDKVDAYGKFDIKVVIPQVDDVGEFELSVNIPKSVGYVTSSADFDVDGLAEIETDYAFGVQGTTINIEGWNFTRISGKKVRLDLYHETVPEGYHIEIEDIEDFETDSKGHFSGTFTVPARSSDKYSLKAIQEDYHIESDTGFRIGLMLILINPSSGPTGTKVVLTGMGFTEDGEWNATFGGISIVEDGVIDLDSNLGTGMEGVIPTFIVPTLDTGQYTLVVNDVSEEDVISVSIEFMVTETTKLVTDPMVAPNEYEVEIKGKYFSELPDNVEFIIYNVTADGEVDKDWDVDIISTPDPVITDDDGNFTTLWKVPESDILSVGDYWINATQENDMFAQYLFSVVEKTVEIEPRKPSFAIGETVYFDVESSFAMDGAYIEIYDPYDNLYWRTDAFVKEEWLKVGTIERVPYYEQTAGGNPMALLDATVGPWFWEMFYEDEAVCNGTFEVTPAPSDILTDRINALSGELSQLADDITGVTDEIAGDIADLSSDISDVEANVQDMIDDITADLAEELAGVAKDTEAAVDELEGSIGDIAAAQNELDSKLDDMGQDTAAAKQAAEDAQRTSQGVTTLVYGAIAASLIAALAAIVSLMQISKKIA